MIKNDFDFDESFFLFVLSVEKKYAFIVASPAASKVLRVRAPIFPSKQK